MDYYEELGLRRTASAEEIHAAYRVLARLVHPDGQQNLQLRAMAECQMRRINKILETLSDANARAAYDLTLVRRTRRRRGGRLDRAAARRHTIEAALWISMVVVVMFGISFFEDSGSQAAKIQALERENAGLRHEVQQLRTGVDQR